MKPIDIALIQARRQKINAEAAAENDRFQKELNEHNRRLAVLSQEARELEIAERVFAKLTKEDDAGSQQSRRASAETGGGKPDGTVPVSEMIKEALAHARSLGRHGLRPAEILSFIQGKYWPAASSSDVGPIAWRMWQRDHLDKFRDGAYGLPDEEDEVEVEVEDDTPDDEEAA